MNDAGLIVGTDWDNSQPDPRFAVIWAHGTETKLDDLAYDPALGQLTSAYDVNQSGMIAGQSSPPFFTYFAHGFVYVPQG